MLAQEGFHEYRNIFAAVAQRRQAQTDSIDPIVELGAKTSRAHFVIQVPAGGGDHARAEHSVSANRHVHPAARTKDCVGK